MPKVDLRMNYETMRAMVKEFEAAKQQLEETLKAVTKLGKDMEGGALQGQAGQTFVGAINGPLAKSLNKLVEKMDEEAQDVDAARAALEDHVEVSRRHFTN
jgi:WXG100 family type VII secretion target